MRQVKAKLREYRSAALEAAGRKKATSSEGSPVGCTMLFSHFSSQHHGGQARQRGQEFLEGLHMATEDRVVPLWKMTSRRCGVSSIEK